MGFSASTPGMDGAGTSRAHPWDDLRVRSSLGPVQGMGQAFHGAASSPHVSEPSSAVLVFLSYRWIIHPCKKQSVPFCEDSSLLYSQAGFFPVCLYKG